jgi:hypothetical protein
MNTLTAEVGVFHLHAFCVTGESVLATKAIKCDTQLLAKVDS